MNSYDIVLEKVREYWKQEYPKKVIVFFYQKYSHDSEWDWCAELVSPYAFDDYETVIFDNDFCEGQTNVKDIHIVPFDEIIDFYVDNHKV